MLNKNIFKQMGGGAQLFFFLFFTLGGLFLAAIVVTAISIPFVSKGENIAQSVTFLKLAQFCQAIFLFLVPALIFSILYNDNPKEYLKVEKTPSLKTIGWTLLLVILVQPILQYTSYLNELMTLPESMQAIETWMRNKELEVEQLIELFLVDKSLTSYLSNIFIVAIVAGCVEEIFFRGCMQNIFKKIFKNIHIAIWITAFIFSAIHLQFYGFIPRLLAGALLGYLYVWGGNLFLPIIAHIAHNAINILMAQFYFGTAQYDDMKNMGISNHIWLVITSSILFVITLYYLNYKRPKNDLNNKKQLIHDDQK